MATGLVDRVENVHSETSLVCPDCQGSLTHGGMGIPVYDCDNCGKMWVASETGLREVTEGCGD